MRSITRIASPVIAASLLTALVVEAAEAVDDWQAPYAEVTAEDDWATIEPIDVEQPAAGPLPEAASAGRTAGWGAVSPAGESNYSIPLNLPPGTGGLTPGLSLEYRQLATDGAMGIGWALGGTSAISRCPRTIAQDGAAGPVTQTRSDRFCLDGMRLVVINGGEYGGAGTEYRSELESFARIRAYGTAGAGPQYFVVEAPDGRILEYGATSDSRIDWSGSASTPRAWALSRIRDRAGNAMDFVYAEDAASGSYRLAAVRYNGNPGAGIAPAHEVTFSYEPRPPADTDLRYVAGSMVQQTQRLRRIDVLHRGALVRRYALDYQPALSAAGHSRLASVRECGRDASTCLPPTSITWQDGTAGLDAERAVAATLGAAAGLDESKRGWAGDLNGDGRDDLVWAGGPTAPATLRYRLALASGALGGEVDTGIPVPRGAGVPIDYDADGLADVLTVSAAGRWIVVRGGAAGLGSALDTGIVANPVDFRGADLDGDGLSDLAYSELASSSGNGLVVRVRYNVRGSGFSASPVTLYEQGPVAGYDPPQGGNFLGRAGQRIDLDGDGREDLLMNEALSIARISADRHMSDVFDGVVSRAVPADVNGDGCTDVVYPHPLGQWRVRFSGCFVVGTTGTAIVGPQYDPSLSRLLAFDWNGDGRDDVLYTDASANWKVVPSAGDRLLPTIDTGIAHGTPLGVAVADLNGDSLPDLATWAGSRLAYRLRAGQAPDLLRSVTDGLGVATTFGYAPLTDPAVYAKGSGATWPQRDEADGRPVVVTLTAGDSAVPDSRTVTSYSFAGLRTDLSGRGDLGFARRVVRQAAPAGLSLEEAYRQDFPFIGLVEREWVRNRAGAVVRDASWAWKGLMLGSGAAVRRYAYPEVGTTRSHDPDAGGGVLLTSTVTVGSVDPLSGLVTDSSMVVTGGTGGGNPGATRTERTQHFVLLNDTGNWCLGRPQSTTVTANHSLAGGAALTRSTAVTWDALACRPVRVQAEPGDPRWQVTVDLAYDGFGNVARRAVTGVGMASRVDAVYWGAQGRFPERLTNPLAQSTLLSWDAGIGRPVAITDANGLRTTIEYDAFGDPVAQTAPDGRRLTWALRHCAGDCAASGRAQLDEAEKASSGELLFARTLDVDAFGRVIRSLTRRIGGGQSHEAAEFDARGRLVRRHLPAWLGGAASGSWLYSYDDRGRLLSETLQGADGAVERSFNHAYVGLARQVTDARGSSTSATTTAWGDTVEVQDPLGARTRYEYDAFGRLLRVRAADGAALADLTYNPFGLKLTHADADLGAWTLTRNALGEVTTQRNAKGQVTTYEYDLLGRLTRRVEPEGTSAWTWGASAASRNVGKLASVSGPGYSEALSYDAGSRLARRSIASEGTHYYDYAYDGAGRLATLTYPASVSGFRLKLGYEYDGAHAVRIRDLSAGGPLLWELGAVDAAGNVLDESRGGRVRVISGHSPATGALEYRQALAGSLPVQDVTYGWDSAGNLRERRDRGRNSLESFTYDAADRLQEATRNGTRDLAMRYDLDGNVTWKSDVCPSTTGCFAYDPAHRHAVTTAGTGRYTYDANGNMTGRNGSSISWYSYDLPSVINQGTSQSRFWYGPGRNRWKQVASGPDGAETTIYIGGLLEKVTQGSATRWRHYLQAPTGTAGIHVRHADGSAPRSYLLTQDHLGGTDTILDAATGTVLVREAFDPFGRRRGGSGLGVPSSAEMSVIGTVTRDGFTGHEHLDNVGLIHMNGRVYDPAIARFLSPDPVVTSPFNRQDLNRYAYAWNNPLSIVDPTGLEEVTCLHGPRGRCQGVTVTGYRDRPPGGAAYYTWRTGSNGQAASAGERDPCGQDGSAAACGAHGPVEESPGSEVALGAGGMDLGGPLIGLGRAGLNLIPGWYYSGIAASQFQRGNYLDAALFYGATVGDVFLLGRGLAMAQASRSLTPATRGASGEHFGPVNPGPLSAQVASTFRSGSYSRRTLEEPLVVYRLIGEGGSPTGRYWTTLEPKGALQSVIDLAIDQNWRNPATQVIRAELPAGTVIYEGTTSAQRGLVGGAHQIYIPRVDPGWLR